MENYATAIKYQFKAFCSSLPKAVRYLLCWLWFDMTLHHFIHNVHDTKVSKALVLIWLKPTWNQGWFFVLLCHILEVGSVGRGEPREVGVLWTV